MKNFAKTLAAAAAIGFALVSHAQSPGHDMKPMMQKNMDQMMSMQPSGDPDVDFARMMREHHVGGVEMAQWQLEHGKDPKMKAMARKVIASQKKDIAEFDRWLTSKDHRGHGESRSKHSK